MKLGDKIKDLVTGLEGIATGRLEYLNGCVQWLIMPPLDKDGKYQDVQWIDQSQLKVIGDGISVKKYAALPGSKAKKAPTRFKR